MLRSEKFTGIVQVTVANSHAIKYLHSEMSFLDLAAESKKKMLPFK